MSTQQRLNPLKTDASPLSYEEATQLLHDMAVTVSKPPRAGGLFQLMSMALAHPRAELLSEVLAERGATAILQAVRAQEAVGRALRVWQ